MRTIPMIVAIVALGGCAGTGDVQRPSSGVPVVKEEPSLSDRLRVSRQQKANQTDLANTEVHGNVINR